MKIGDFGIAKRVTNQSTALRTETGTPYFSAPETQPDDYQETFEYTNAVDMWSLGCVVYNSLAQRPPFESLRAKASPFSTQHLKGRVNVDGVAFLECLLKVDPSTGWTAQETLDHPWLQSITDSSNSADDSLTTSRRPSGYHASAVNGYDSMISQTALLDIQSSTSSRTPKSRTASDLIVSDSTAAATMVASKSKAKTTILAPRGAGLTEPKGKSRSKESSIEKEQSGRALIAPVRKDRDKFRERTVLGKDSSVKDQSSKFATYESDNPKTEV